MDENFGPFFLKFCSYFPYNAKLCLNGHEWAKWQAAKAEIAHTALDNGFATCEDPAAVQAICDRLGPEEINGQLQSGWRSCRRGTLALHVTNEDQLVRTSQGWSIRHRKASARGARAWAQSLIVPD